MLLPPRLTDNRECLALLDREFTPSTAWNRPHLPTQNPGADREVLDQSFDNDQVRVGSAPASAGCCAGAVTVSAQSRVPRSARVRSGIDDTPRCGRVRLGPVRAELLAATLVSRGKGAARVEWAAGRHMDEAGGVPGIASSRSLRASRRHRPEQAPGVGVGGSVEQLVGAAILHRAAGVHDQYVVGDLGNDAEVVGDQRRRS